MAFAQGIALHDFIGQHRQLVARHVHRRQARATERIERAAGQHGQPRRGNMDAQRDAAAAQSLHRQRIVNLGGGGVVDGKRPDIGQRQLVLDLRRLQGRETRALGKVLKQKALPVKLVGRGNRPGALQQIERCQVRGARGFHHGLVFSAVFVGLEKNFVKLFAHRRRALALAQFTGPGADLRGQLLFLFDGVERQLQNLGRRLLEAALAGAPEIVRCVVQAEQRRGLLLQRGGF